MGIDWGKIGGSESTPPVGPVQPVTTPAVNLPDGSTNAPQPGSQAAVDALSPWDRAGRGLDVMGQAIFGRGVADPKLGLPELTGSPLGQVPVLGDAIGAVGNFVHGTGAVAVKPFEAATAGLARIPLGWLPGGADDTFNQFGEHMKVNDPEGYQTWLAVKAASDGDVLFGGNLKADFNMRAAEFYDDQTKEGFLGTNLEMSMGRTGIGSVGGALSHAIQGWLGIAGGEVQSALGGAGVFDPSGSVAALTVMGQRSNSEDLAYANKQFEAGLFSESERDAYIAENVGADRSRVVESLARLERGHEVSDTERQAAEAFKSGAWTEEHANDFIVRHGQSITRNVVGQILGSVVTDPLTYASIGAGSVSTAGRVGKQVLESGVGAASNYQKLAVVVAEVQGSELGPAFRIARGLIDPLATYKPTPAARALIDLKNGVAIKAFGNAYGEKAVREIRAVAREMNMTTEVDSAVGAYSIDKANEMIATNARRSMMEEGLGAELVRTNVDDVVAPLAENAGPRAVKELTDHMYAVAKNTFTEEEGAALAGRMTAVFGGDTTTWTTRLAALSGDGQSGLHAVTYKLSEKQLAEALAQVDPNVYAGKLPLNKMVLMTSETLDTVHVEAVIANATTGTLKARTAAWNAAARRYPHIAAIGLAPGGKKQLNALIEELKGDIEKGVIGKRVLDEELADPALAPVLNMLDRHTIDGKRLWNIGFRPDEEVAWGMKRNAADGRWMADQPPTISHVMDAVPGRQPFSDTTRNVLGQIIGKRAAETANAPVDAMEAFLNTSRDVVSGRRLVLNMERRFEKSMFEQAGIPKPVIKEIFEKAREVAGLDHTTLRGLASGENSNLWKAVKDSIPENVRLPGGQRLDIHTLMEHLLTAAEGDMRIMGVTSVMTQRMRNTLRRSGLDPMNWSGQMTVTAYNKLRYSQPTFLIQRITDAPYYGMLYGVNPIGGGKLKGALAELRKIEENMARTGTARDFSIDMPEYATRANFTGGILTSLENMTPFAKRAESILNAPDAIISNNMTKQLHARLGTIVRGVLDDVDGMVKDAPPELAAEMRAEMTGPLSRSFADWRATYSQAAGRVLDDEETGLKYVQEMLNSARRVRTTEHGLDMQQLIHEGERSLPSSIGEIGPIRPDDLAIQLGYPDAAALRKDINGSFQKVGTKFELVDGQKSIEWLEERLADDLSAHPDYVKRAVAYFGGTWDDYWHRLATPIEGGGLDISPRAAREAQDLIAKWAADRGMDPWEYLSGVMATNIGPGDLDTTVGQLMGFLQSGASSQPMEAWTKVFRSTLDISGQTTLIEEFDKALPGLIEEAMKAGDTVKSQALNKIAGLRRGGTAESGGAVKAMPEPWRDSSINPYADKTELVSVEDLTPFRELDREVTPKFRGDSAHLDELTEDIRVNGFREPVIINYDPQNGLALLGEGNHRLAVAKRLGLDGIPVRVVKTNLAGDPKAVFMTNQGMFPKLKINEHGYFPADASPSAIGFKSIRGEDPFDAFFDTHFPEMVRKRILEGTPHPNIEVEGYIQQFSHWVQTSLSGELSARTRSDLKRLVESVPTTERTTFNRTHSLVVNLLKDQIRNNQTDIFRLAEMATERSVLERSINHPLFGLYPASYMWSKVLPETIKFLAKNPYASTYTIANVQRSIATQREYDTELDGIMEQTDRSSAAFLLDYLTPGLPWSDHSARFSPLVRGLFEGKDVGEIWSSELATVSPERWVRLFADTATEFAELPGALEQSAPAPSGLESLEPLPSAPLAGPAPEESELLQGPTSGMGLAPLLAEDLIRLQEVLTGG